MRHRISQLGALPVLATALMFLACLASCDTRTTTRQVPPTPTGYPTRDLSTFTPTPIPTPMFASLVPADTADWPIYRDRMFPFQMPIPPSWRYGAFVEDREGRTNCQEVIGLMPPGTSWPIVEGFDEKTTEYIALYVNINCTPYDPTGDPHAALESSQIAVGGTTVRWYYEDLPPYPSSRVVVADFGAQSYEFLVVAPRSTAPRDIAVYLGMMKGFRYLD